MKSKIALLFLCFCASVLSQEKINTLFLDSLTYENKTIYEVNTTAIYYSKNNSFYKKSKEDELVFTAISLGNLTHVDIYNPLQIVLFYKDFNTVILLDRQLNETHRIEGNKIESILNFDYVGLASQNQIWFYDFVIQKIGLYNFNTETFKFISTPQTHKIIDYTTDYNYFYWIDDERNLHRISIYGSIQSYGEVPTYEAIQILTEENYIIKKENKLHFFNGKEHKSYEISISENSFDKYYYKNGILSIFTPNKVINYKILLP